MKIDKINLTGKKETFEITGKIFSNKNYDKLIQTVIYKQNANFKKRKAKTKQKNEIIGSTSKIYAQKGTGNARHASRKAPIFVGGGVAHGPKGENAYKIRKLNKNEKKVSVSAIISKKHKTNNLIVFEDFKSTISKTKKMFEILNQNDAKNAILILDKTSKENIYKSAKNIPNIKITDVNHFSSFDLLKYNKIIFTETSIKELEKYQERLSNEITELEKSTINNSDEEKLKILQDEFNTIEQNRKDLKEEKVYKEATRAMLQDTGIKTKIIKQYLPIMNQLINKYLASMEFYVNFSLDENFDETIKSRFRDNFNYESFSEGEKMRIDLALLFTWRAIAKMKNSTNTNLLILDEIFDSSLDSAGTDEFLKILNTLEGENVFVISHKQDVLVDKFKHTLRFEKNKNFSKMASV